MEIGKLLWENRGNGDSYIYANVDGMYVPVHSCVARCAFSAFFGNTTNMAVVPFGSCTIEQVLYFVYLGKVELERHEIRPFLRACLFLGVRVNDVSALLLNPAQQPAQEEH